MWIHKEFCSSATSYTYTVFVLKPPSLRHSIQRNAKDKIQDRLPFLIIYMTLYSQSFSFNTSQLERIICVVTTLPFTAKMEKRETYSTTFTQIWQPQLFI